VVCCIRDFISCVLGLFWFFFSFTCVDVLASFRFVPFARVFGHFPEVGVVETSLLICDGQKARRGGGDDDDDDGNGKHGSARLR